MYKLKNKKGQNSATVSEMIELYEQGLTMKEIARRYNITRQCVMYYLKLSPRYVSRRPGPRKNVVVIDTCDE